MTPRGLEFRIHAVQRMFERRISQEDVYRVLWKGKTIEQYPEDTPWPSRLVLGWVKSRPLHVVVADDLEFETTIVITVYEPDPEEWEPDFATRKKR